MFVIVVSSSLSQHLYHAFSLLPSWRHPHSSRMSWYFGMFCVWSLICAIWAAGITDKMATEALSGLPREECGKINDFLKVYALVYVCCNCSPCRCIIISVILLYD